MTIATETAALVTAMDQFGTSLANRVKAGGAFEGRAYTIPSVVAFSATPEFDALLSNVFHLGVLTTSVSSSTIINPADGQSITIRVVQDAVGGWTFAVPANAVVAGTPTTDANDVNLLVLTYVAALSRWEGNWINVPA